MMKEEEPVMFSAPRRLLLGVAFLLWGAMHDQPLPALIAAIVMEGRHWTNLRWTTGNAAFRATRLSLFSFNPHCGGNGCGDHCESRSE